MLTVIHTEQLPVYILVYQLLGFYLGYILSCSYPDIVVYLWYMTSFVTLDEVKNYKSLQSYKYFTSGWVLEVEWKKYREEGIRSSQS